MELEPHTALVLGGGGLTGIAWETGLLLGLERHGIPLRSADLTVGTSAGSTVAAQIAGPTPLDELYDAQIEGRVEEIPGKLGMFDVVRLYLAFAGARDQRVALSRVGARALRANTVAERARRAVIEQRLPVHSWPERALRIPAVNARTGELATFDADSGVPLVDAVAASCAVPMVWPTVTIGNERYFDGGFRSSANVDLAAGHDRVVVITPSTRTRMTGMGPGEQLNALDTCGSALVAPDAGAMAGMGENVLNPALRPAAARAGLAQADRVVEKVRAAVQ